MVSSRALSRGGQLRDHRGARPCRFSRAGANHGTGRKEDVHARAKADDAHPLTLDDALAFATVVHDAPRDEAGDLPNEDATAARLDTDGHLLILEARLLRRSMEELSAVVVNVAHRAVDRIPVDVNVEHVHEDR